MFVVQPIMSRTYSLFLHYIFILHDLFYCILTYLPQSDDNGTLFYFPSGVRAFAISSIYDIFILAPSAQQVTSHSHLSQLTLPHLLPLTHPHLLIFPHFPLLTLPHNFLLTLPHLFSHALTPPSTHTSSSLKLSHLSVHPHTFTPSHSHSTPAHFHTPTPAHSHTPSLPPPV